MSSKHPSNQTHAYQNHEYCFDVLVACLSTYTKEPDIKQIRKAYQFALLAHKSQYRKSGEPYVTHPVAVAKILAEMHMDCETIIGGLLHDVIEDTGYDKSYITQHFGQKVAEIVDGVSKISHINKQVSDKQKQADNLYKMLLAITKDLRVIIVKLVDRLHNLRTINALPANKRTAIAKETMDIYIPIAHRLGMNAISIELEDLAMEAAYPLRYQRISKAINKASIHRKDYIETLKENLTRTLEKAGINARIEGRKKNIASIYHKMSAHRQPNTDSYNKDKKRRSFNEIMDVYGFRIVTANIDDCYRVLGYIHNLYKPFPNRFKDYIASPKINGYQSLHTTLMGIKGYPIEIQIRTEEMHNIANSGIAAHWIYKHQTSSTDSIANSKTWIQDILELQEKTNNSLEFLQQIKLNLYPKEIFVFTPEGKIINLPTDATPIDFAYAIHTDVGNRCIACEIDGQPATLSNKLKTGQVVKIITSAESKPNLTWSTFAITAKALSNITHSTKKLQHQDAVLLGKRLLNNALEHLGSHIEKITEAQLANFLKTHQIKNTEHLYKEIGLGKLIPFNTANSLLNYRTKNPGNEINLTNQATIHVGYNHSLVIHCAKCCYPIPGDNIIAVPSLGKGIAIHRKSCSNIREIKNNPEKTIAAQWESHTHHHPGHQTQKPNKPTTNKAVQKDFIAKIKVEVPDQRNIIARLVHQVNESQADIENISMEERNARLSSIKLHLVVKNRVHLARVIKSLRKIETIQNIIRS